MDGISDNEIEVICAQCEFPTVTEYDDKGKVTSFRELEAPATYEAALAEGWMDHGMGLYCPKCSLKYMEELQRDEDAGAKSGMAGDILEVTDAMALRSICPGLSDDTYEQFTKMYRTARIAAARAALGLPTVDRFIPLAQYEGQGEEFEQLIAALGKAQSVADGKPKRKKTTKKGKKK